MALKKPNNYSLSTLLTFLGSAGLVVAITLLHALNLGDVCGWLLDFAYGTELFIIISQMLSGNGYFFLLIDKLTREKTLFEKIGEQISLEQYNNAQNIVLRNNLLKSLKNDRVFLGLVIGVLSAVGLTIAEILLHTAVPFSGLGSIVSHGILLIANLSLCGGLGNRTGRVADYFKTNKKSFRAKDVNYALSILVGVAIGITVVGLVLGLAGITVISGGSALPVILFCASVIGGSASASGYIGRVFDFMLGQRTIFGAIADLIKTKPKNEVEAPLLGKQLKPAPEPISQRVNNENVLTTAGLVIGITVGVILIITGLTMLPLFGSGLPKLAAGFVVIASCISAAAGTGNRVGAACDRKSWKFWEWFGKAKPTTNPPQPNNVLTHGTNLYSHTALACKKRSAADLENTTEDKHYSSPVKRAKLSTDLNYKNQHSPSKLIENSSNDNNFPFTPDYRYG